ncbi:MULTISPECIES: alpha/beta fold hydrolase [Roseomonadaceae]|uniref:Alpha/beta hydrolase n=1 Tax=Falsiroseomonas oleicola TaxID=2801474 RepID=A0ABS6HBP0_9PROT|nr:alpha/beta hydrolase [Roseomonas oleicola]MBU8546120.1 alpha/beta hydrolase [Roseomonas oleicola]
MKSVQWTVPESFDFNGQSVRFGVMGDGPPLVLVHGTPFSSYVWHRIAPHLAAWRRVFYFDLIGYGLSAMNEGQDISLGVQNRLLAELLRHWDLEHPDVVAHDFGGATALRTHLLNGCDFRSLTLVDPVALRPWGSPFVRHVRRYEAAFAGLPPQIHEAILAAYVAGAAHRRLTAEELQPYLKPWIGPVGQSAFYRQIAQMDEHYTAEVEDRYAEIRCPLLVVWGEEDAWLPIEQGRNLAARVPGSRFLPVARAAHLVQEDAPEALVAALLDFLPRVA